MAPGAQAPDRRRVPTNDDTPPDMGVQVRLRNRSRDQSDAVLQEGLQVHVRQTQTLLRGRWFQATPSATWGQCPLFSGRTCRRKTPIWQILLPAGRNSSMPMSPHPEKAKNRRILASRRPTGVTRSRLGLGPLPFEARDSAARQWRAGVRLAPEGLGPVNEPRGTRRAYITGYEGRSAARFRADAKVTLRSDRGSVRACGAIEKGREDAVAPTSPCHHSGQRLNASQGAETRRRLIRPLEQCRRLPHSLQRGVQ